MNQQLSKTRELAELNTQVNALLPARYQHCYSSVPAGSMGSASLKYGADGRVLWDSIWTTFCDLALAGGPPHRGQLLEPVSEAEALSDTARYEGVVAETRRAIALTAELPTAPGSAPGWLGVQCESTGHAAWLQLAVTAENVSARRRADVLQLPAGPAFRVEKEIKNVVVALAKSHHYWDGHLSEVQQTLGEGDLWEPAAAWEADTPEHRATLDGITQRIRALEMQVDPSRYAGWIGVETADEAVAVWLLRAVLINRLLARREGATLYLPVGGAMSTVQADRLVDSLARAWRLHGEATARD
ncbi:MAG: hypothetical protein U0836_11690 [Pirellulales bacterium]